MGVGLSKFVPWEVMQERTVMAGGTYGYLAPEFVYRNELTTKSDVYSFGVLLLDIVSSYRPAQAVDSNGLAEYIRMGHTFCALTSLPGRLGSLHIFFFFQHFRSNGRSEGGGPLIHLYTTYPFYAPKNVPRCSSAATIGPANCSKVGPLISASRRICNTNNRKHTIEVFSRC